jgi:hypothetical protein
MGKEELCLLGAFSATSSHLYLFPMASGKPLKNFKKGSELAMHGF